MAENKTQPTNADVASFLAQVPDPKRREDAQTLCRLLRDATGEEPVMWGGSIVGFGRYHYRYDSGREGDAPLVGFSPRSKELVLYLECAGDWRGDLFQRLGRHRAGKSCLYIKSLAEVDANVLRDLVRRSLAVTREKYPA
jgi:hypothetical protein